MSYSLRFASCFAVLGVLGCAAEETAPSVEGPACSVSWAGEAVVAEGGRSALGLLVEGPVDELELVPGEGLSKARLEGMAAVVETPYGGPSSVELIARYRCGEAQESVALAAEVRRLRWGGLPGWTPGVDGPPGREYGTMWIDQVDPDRLLMWGGFHYEPQQFTPANDAWAFDLGQERWTALSPLGAPLRPGGGLVAIPGEASAYYFGGLAGDATPASLFQIDYGSGAPSFVDVSPADLPVGDYQPSVVYDAPRRRLVTACGANTMWGWHCRVRVLDLDTGVWTEVVPEGPAPAGRNGHLWVHDAENERLIIFAGDRGSGGWACDCAQDTWALELGEEPMRWVELVGPQDPPIGRRNGASALDPVGHRMFVWGGTADGQTTVPGLFALDLDRGEERWEQVALEDGPPVRSSAMGVYDAARHRILFGFGNGDGGVHVDLWALSL